MKKIIDVDTEEIVFSILLAGVVISAAVAGAAGFFVFGVALLMLPVGQSLGCGILSFVAVFAVVIGWIVKAVAKHAAKEMKQELANASQQQSDAWQTKLRTLKNRMVEKN